MVLGKLLNTLSGWSSITVYITLFFDLYVLPKSRQQPPLNYAKRASLTAPNTAHVSPLTPLTLVSPPHINIRYWLELSPQTCLRGQCRISRQQVIPPLSPVSQVHQVQTCDFAPWPVPPACCHAHPNTRRERERERGGKVMRNVDLSENLFDFLHTLKTLFSINIICLVTRFISSATQVRYCPFPLKQNKQVTDPSHITHSWH